MNANGIAPLADVVRDHVLAACEASGWNMTLTAGALKVALKTVYNHLNRYEEQGFVVRTGGGWQRVTQQQGGGDDGDRDGGAGDGGGTDGCD